MTGLVLNLLAFLNRIRLQEHPLGILYFHRVLTQADPFYPDDFTIEEFDALIGFLAKFFSILRLDEALALQDQGRLPPLSICITFDDGYLDNYLNAMPILNKHQVKATFFIATQGITDGILWNGRITHLLKDASFDARQLEQFELKANTESKDTASLCHALINHLKFMPNDQRDEIVSWLESTSNTSKPDREMMDAAQLRTLVDQGHVLGGHTHSHAILAFQDDKTAQREVTLGQDLLYDISAKSSSLFAYPNGLYGRDFSDREVKILQQQGYQFAFSTNDGGCLKNTSNFIMPRFLPYRRDLRGFALSTAKVMGENE